MSQNKNYPYQALPTIAGHEKAKPTEFFRMNSRTIFFGFTIIVFLACVAFNIELPDFPSDTHDALVPLAEIKNSSAVSEDDQTSTTVSYSSLPSQPPLSAFNSASIEEDPIFTTNAPDSSNELTSTENYPTTTFATTTTKRPKSSLACRIPQLDPLDPSIKHLIEEPEKEDCTDEYPLLFDSNLDSTLIPTENLKENASALGVLSCCYKTLDRGNKPSASDNYYNISKSCEKVLDLWNATDVEKETHEYVVIECDMNKTAKAKTKSGATSRPWTKKTKVMDMHFFVPLKSEVENRTEMYYSQIANNASFLREDERLNVVILGIDGCSHMNFIRTMPKTFSYLMNNLSAIEMHGVNKVGDNTYPNIAALMTSKSKTEVESTCEEDQTFDKCPFIWKDFASNGFRTSYAEDSPWMGIFNYLKKGFKVQPTDYYFRPFSYAAEKIIGTHKKMNAKLCYGPRLSFQVFMNYLKKFAYTMGSDKRYFQFVWASSLTHDYLNVGQLGDEYLKATLEWFQNENYLNKTAFILMSDHGIRWGEIRSYAQGRLEERLPFLYFIFPEWFKKRYPRAIHNLIGNAEKLTTPFDMHETLKDFVNLRGIEEDEIKKREKSLEELVGQGKIPRGISYFLPVPITRNCEMADIAEHFCTCHNTSSISTTRSVVEQAANFLVYYINLMISKYLKCAYLSLSKIIDANEMEVQVEGKDVLKPYLISIQTSPGEAVFEASVVRNKQGSWRVAGTISRINLYGNQSYCVDEKDLKLYCYCVNFLNLDEKRR